MFTTKSWMDNPQSVRRTIPCYYGRYPLVQNRLSSSVRIFVCEDHYTFFTTESNPKGVSSGRMFLYPRPSNEPSPGILVFTHPLEHPTTLSYGGSRTLLGACHISLSRTIFTLSSPEVVGGGVTNFQQGP